MFPVKNIKETKNFIDQIKKEHYQATHNCPAFRVWVQVYNDLFGNIQLSHEQLYASDDWEPSGTASYPMKQILEKENIFDIVVVVTRYFGGTLLGVWWLIQAYTDSVKIPLENAPIIYKEILDDIKIVYSYNDISKINQFIQKYDITQINQNFEKNITLYWKINIALKELFLKEIDSSWILSL